MFYIVYKTTNKLNGKIYVGIHRSAELNDDYLGSGKILLRAIKKYGRENFSRENIFVFDNPEKMFQMESFIVNSAFIKEENTYNRKLGGIGGWDHYHGSLEHKESTVRGGKSAHQKFIKKFNEEKELNSDWYKDFCKKQGEKLQKHNNRTFSQEHRNKLRKFGEDNSLFNRRWVCCPSTKEVLLLSKDTNIEIYLKDNPLWIRGKAINANINSPNRAFCWVNKNEENKFIKKNELDKYLTNGWNKGRLNPTKKMVVGSVHRSVIDVKNSADGGWHPP